MHIIKSFFGSALSVFAYIKWMDTLNVAALVVAIASGAATLGYTIDKWRILRKEKRAKKN